jgi:hypothetical protein
LYHQLILDLTPRLESSTKLVSACHISETPVAVVEAGIAELFSVHKSVLAATKNEEHRNAILPRIHESFLSEFGSTAAKAGLVEGSFLALIARRLQTYDSLMDQGIPQWTDSLSQQIFEAITGGRADTALYAAVGIIILTEMNETTKFLRKVLG